MWLKIAIMIRIKIVKPNWWLNMVGNYNRRFFHNMLTDHAKGSHGNPGIYFKYDMSALKVVIKEDRENVASFLIRLCSVIAGIVVICGFLNSIIQAVFDRLFGYFLPQYKELGDSKVDTTQSTPLARSVHSNYSQHAKTNLLLTNDMLQDGGIVNSQFIPFK